MADVRDKSALARADNAKRILDDQEFTSAVAVVRSAILDRFAACPIRDTEGMQALRLQLKCLDDVLANLQSVVNTGKVMREQMAFMDRMKRKVQNVW